MERAERALIMAAGYGHRMEPVTSRIPKPLVPVHGVRIIDNQIEALHRAGVNDIVVVTGYLAEQFRDLETRYPGVRLVYNPDYSRGNNITSLYYARRFLDRPVIIMDGDILIRSPGVLDLEIACSAYCCTWEESDPREWYFRHEGDWVISRVVPRIGPGWQLRSISFWTSEDANRLRGHLESAYEKDGLRDAFWDEIPLFYRWGEYKIRIRPLERTDILELDTFRDLCLEDPSYLSSEGKEVQGYGYSQT